MMTQENSVNINDLHGQGWTSQEIAEQTGWHRTTVSDRLKNGPPPEARVGQGIGDDRALAVSSCFDGRGVAEDAIGEHSQQARRDGLRGLVSDRGACCPL